MPGFDDTRMHNDASSIGSLSFVSRDAHLHKFPRAFPPTLTTDGF